MMSQNLNIVMVRQYIIVIQILSRQPALKLICCLLEAINHLIKQKRLQKRKIVQKLFAKFFFSIIFRKKVMKKNYIDRAS